MPQKKYLAFAVLLFACSKKEAPELKQEPEEAEMSDSVNIHDAAQVIAMENDSSSARPLLYRCNTASKPMITDLDGDQLQDTIRLATYSGALPDHYQISNPFDLSDTQTRMPPFAIEVFLSSDPSKRFLLADSSLFSTPMYEDSAAWTKNIVLGPVETGVRSPHTPILVGIETGGEIALWFRDGEFKTEGSEDED